MTAKFPWIFMFTAIASAAPVNLGTFSVSGSGSFSCDRQDGIASYSVSFSGTNGSDAITVSSPGLGGSNFGGNLQFPCFGSSVGENTVLADTFPPAFDSIQPIQISFDANGPGGFISPFGTFQLGNGGGSLDIYAPGSMPRIPGPLMWTADLIGYVTVDSLSTTGPPDVSASGTFVITPGAPDGAPEPGSAALVLAAAIALRSYFALARGCRRGVFRSSANSKPLR